MTTTTKTPWTPEKIAARTQRIFAEQLGVDDEEVTQDAVITADLGADSLDFVEVIMAFEEEFALEIPDADAEKLMTVRDVNHYIGKKLAKVAHKT